jgi:hypothetical protein
MFINQQDKTQVEYYQKMLKVIGGLSKLSSDSEEPFLYYRVAENLFCKSFNAENLSRSDTSADASIGNVGFGLKTFLKRNGNGMEKVAEFNTDSSKFRNLPVEEQVQEISRLRNERIETTKRIYGLNEIIYHCITRSTGVMEIIESPMNSISRDKIKIKSSSEKSILFADDKEEYSFNISKSTLLKRFKSDNVLMQIPVDIVEDPFLILEKLFEESSKEIKSLIFSPIKVHEHVFLPLYSTRSGQEEKEVPEKSGLNQWNAKPRLNTKTGISTPRNLSEVYIPIPAWIHKSFGGFFPEIGIPFTLRLPNRQQLEAKVCQDGHKALMTNPNKALGEWILRDVLNLKDGELLTYKKLEDIGLDSVVIYKISELEYEIDFAQIESYESFKEKHLN